MKNNAFFDKVKDYFQSSITELKTDKSYQKKFILVSCIEFVLLAFTIVLDLCLKEYLYDFWVKNGSTSYTVIKGFLDITYTQNTGAAFGSFSNGTLALTIVTTIVIVIILGFLLIAKRRDMWLRLSLVFIAGGGIGNLVDRIGLGYVRDFFEFTFTTKWGIFNIADCFVSVGAVMLVGYLVYLIVKDAVAIKKQKDAKDKENGNLNQGNAENSLANDIVEDTLKEENSTETEEEIADLNQSEEE
ncbi:MAG: signal peptidase II [Clostridia bacterium]|nr:signal peptidase II [Clostridia bacterium]